MSCLWQIAQCLGHIKHGRQLGDKHVAFGCNQGYQLDKVRLTVVQIKHSSTRGIAPRRIDEYNIESVAFVIRQPLHRIGIHNLHLLAVPEIILSHGTASFIQFNGEASFLNRQ